MRQDGQQDNNQDQRPQAQPRHSNLPAPVPHALSTRPSQGASSSSTPHSDLPAYFNYAPSSSSFLLDPPGAPRPTVRRPRSQKACNRCHRRKARCTRNLMEDGTYRCDNCIRDNIECEWREAKRRGPKPKSTASASPTPQRSVAAISNLLNEGEDTRTSSAAEHTRVSSDAEEIRRPVVDRPAYAHARRPAHVQPPLAGQLIDDFYSSPSVSRELRTAIDAYYTHLYATCSVLHPATLLRQALANTLDPLLHDALLACSLALSRRLAGAQRLLDRIALALFSLTEEQPSVPQMCAFQLAATVRLTCGAQRYDMFGAALARLVRQLGWHMLDPAGEPESWDAWVTMETKRRVFWAVRRADAWHALVAGHVPSAEFAQGVTTLLPCPDALWDELGEDPDVCLAQGLRLGRPPVELLDRLAQAMHRAADQHPWALGSSPLGQQLDSELRAFRASLSSIGSPTTPSTSFFGPRHTLHRALLLSAHLHATAPLLLLHLAGRRPRTLRGSMLTHVLSSEIDAQARAVCVAAARECAGVLQEHRDVPLRLVGPTAPFCVFVAAAVLLRYATRGALQAELRVLWRALNESAVCWPAEDYIAALRDMRIDEILRPADDRTPADPRPRSPS